MWWNNLMAFFGNEIIPLFTKFGVPVLQWGGWLLLGSFILFVFHHGDKVDKWTARIERWLLLFGFRREKKYITRDIRSRINIASKKINKEAEGASTKGIEIIWVDSENIESFLRNGKVVIRMRQHENQDKNIVSATEHYVKKGVLHIGKRYLSDNIRDALDFSITKKILSEEADDGSALEFFSINRLEPTLRSNEALEENFSIYRTNGAQRAFN